MEESVRPVLTIGLIVKNEIRCIERCLKSLEPLRKALPCELVIADTGSDDGTKEIAEKYADLVFDFEWVNDFAAARNAVLDRAQGEWFLTMDADEWLDGDFRELTEFMSYQLLRDHFNLCGITIRNYHTEDFDTGFYGEFLALRLFKLSSGVRYKGIVHESPSVPSPSFYAMSHLVFHHDGYVIFGDKEKGKAKSDRNMKLLRKKLAEDPQDLMTLIQCIESGRGDETFGYLRQALQGVREKLPAWDTLGPNIYRHAAALYAAHDMPELWDMVQEALETFPQSMMVRAEINYLALDICIKKEDFPGAVRYGEAYLQAMEDYHNNQFSQEELLHMVITATSPFCEQASRVRLAKAYYERADYPHALETAGSVDVSQLDDQLLDSLFCTLLNVYTHSSLDLSGPIQAFWSQLSAPVPDQKRANGRKALISLTAQRAFSPKFQEKEREEGLARCAYTLFAPLKETCELGIAAAVIETAVPEELDRLLAQVGDWQEFPIHALAHAIDHGAAFPCPELPMETLDSLAFRLAGVGEDYLPKLCLCLEGIPETTVDLNWMRALFLAAVQTADPEECGCIMELARRFAAFETGFLPRCYAPAALAEEGQPLLPPLHRFGAALAEAFDALDAGDLAGFVRSVREGLTRCEAMKPLAEYLCSQAKSWQNAPSPELLALAEQVKKLLAAYPEGHPAAAAIRQSEAYRQVAWLLETPAAE